MGLGELLKQKSIISPTNTFTEYIDGIEYKKKADRAVKVFFIKCAMKISKNKMS